MRLIIILVLAFNSMADLKPLKQPKARKLLHYGNMYLIDVKISGSLFTPDMPKQVRNAEYLHEIFGKKHYWNWGNCREKRDTLICKEVLEYSDTESFRFLWKFKKGNLIETVIYNLDGSMIEATWQGQLSKVKTTYFEWDLGFENFGF